MKKTKLFAILFCFVLAVASFGFAACAPKTDDTDKTAHRYDTVWTSDKDEHYRKCTDEGCAEVKDKAAHTFTNGVCTVCGYKVPTAEETNARYTNFVNSVSDLKAEEGFTARIKNANVVIKNTDINIDKADGYETIKADVYLNANAELFIGKDANGKFTAKIHAEITGEAKNADKAAQPAYADVIATAKITATVVAEGGKVYLRAAGESKYDGIPAAYQPYNGEENFDYPMSMTYEELFDFIMALLPSDGDSTIGAPEVSIKEIIKTYAEKIFGAIGELLSTVDVDQVKAFAVDYLKALIEQNYKVTETENVYTVSVDFDKIARIVNDLADLTVSEYYDKYAKEGNFEELCNTIIKALDFNVEFIVGKLDEAGIDVNAVVAKIDSVLESVGGIPVGDVTVTRIEDFLNLGEGVTLKDFLLSEKVKDVTIEQMITMAVGDKVDFGEGGVKAYLNTYFEMLKNTSFTTIIANRQDIETEKFNKIFKTFVNGYKNIYKSLMSASVSVDKDGKFLSFNMTVTFGEGVIKAVEDTLTELNKIDPEQFSSGIETMPNFEFVVSVNFTKGKFVTDFDYNAFIESFTATEQAA